MDEQPFGLGSKHLMPDLDQALTDRGLKALCVGASGPAKRMAAV
jgi:hypothetical protein